MTSWRLGTSTTSTLLTLWVDDASNFAAPPPLHRFSPKASVHRGSSRTGPVRTSSIERSSASNWYSRFVAPTYTIPVLGSIARCCSCVNEWKLDEIRGSLLDVLVEDTRKQIASSIRIMFLDL